MVADQQVTDYLKYAPTTAPIRWAHDIAERGLGLVGMGDLLMVRARKRPPPSGTEATSPASPPR